MVRRNVRSGQLGTQREHVAGAETEVRVRELVKRLAEQAGGDQNDRREGDLCADQRGTEKALVGSDCGAAMAESDRKSLLTKRWLRTAKTRAARYMSPVRTRAPIVDFRMGPSRESVGHQPLQQRHG